MAIAAVESIREDFAVLDDWEDRYRYVIELGRQLPVLDDSLRVPANKVRGCASQVWIASRATSSGDGPILTFVGDSDALIVKGLIAIAFALYSGRPAAEILAADAGALLAEFDLDTHLTPQRSNGFAAMVARIKSDAVKALAASGVTA